MKLIEAEEISRMCDYSFGDQSGSWQKTPNHFMKLANPSNMEFVELTHKWRNESRVITLFIDNIRLYRRTITQVKKTDREYVEKLMIENDLLALCATYPNLRFVIYTGLEDTPTDHYIFDSIPNNVLRIYAAQANAFGGKVIPFPVGLQRPFSQVDKRIAIIENYVANDTAELRKKRLLYINHSNQTHPDRCNTKDLFLGKRWCRVEKKRLTARKYYKRVAESFFMICPEGNALDCHRTWECLYLGVVPVMKWHPYLESLHANNPVLFVNKYEEITEDFLWENMKVSDSARNLEKNHLDLDRLLSSHEDEYKLNTN